MTNQLGLNKLKIVLGAANMNVMCARKYLSFEGYMIGSIEIKP